MIGQDEPLSLSKVLTSERLEEFIQRLEEAAIRPVSENDFDMVAKELITLSKPVGQT